MSPALDPNESAELAPAGYALWRLETAPLEIRISVHALEAMAVEGANGGVLYGHRPPDNPEVVWIESLAPTAREAVVGTWSRDADPGGEEDAGLHLRIAPYPSGALTAQCYLRNPAGTFEPAWPMFALPTGNAAPAHRRLVPDFDAVAADLRPPTDFSAPVPPTSRPVRPISQLRRLGPLLAAVALVGGAVGAFVLFTPAARVTAPRTPSARPDPTPRPLGLYVDPAGPEWRISWNPAATMLRDARSVRLFVQDGDGQNVVELTPQDLESATYHYQPKGNDVTFRLETTDREGRITAESFRLLNTVTATPAEEASTPPRASHRVAPVVAAGVRPRIKGKIPVDVRVEIDSNGLVVAAAPLTKPRRGLETYLTERAVRAAREWRFEPATKNHKPVGSAHTIHFMFGH